MLSTFAMDRFMPELVATVAGVIATAGICVIALVVQLLDVPVALLRC